MGAIAASNPVRQIRVLPLGTLSDERLAELAGAGQSEAFGALYERYREALSRYCRSIVRDTEDAGDALQNTMLSVLRALQGRGPSGPVRPWIYRIAHNESISILRRRHPHEELSDETPDRADTELASLAKYRLDSLLTDLRSLPENQRGALVMRELGGLEYAEIADALDTTAVSARKHVFEARVALHDIADGRDTDCNEIVRRISDGDGRVLRARSVRGHLRGCPSCSAFERGMRTRRETLGLIPAFPVVTAGAVFAAILHAGGATTSGLAVGGSLAGGSLAGGSLAGGSVAGGSVAGGSLASGSVAGGSLAGGSVAGGTIAVGSMAAVGSLLGGGSFAAIKGMAIAGAIAVAGAGVIVGTGINSHARHPHQAAQVAARSARRSHVRNAVAAAPALPNPVRLAAARAPAIPTRIPSRPAGVSAPASTSHNGSPVAYTPPAHTAPASSPNTQAPATAVPVAMTTPTTTSTPTPPPGATSTTAAPTTSAPATGTSTPATSETATTLWIDSIIESALSRDNNDVAAAEAQAEQRLYQAGYSPTSAGSTIQGLITTILSGLHR
jgi:RNA polymerase sigma factor (sigma-70 family)